MGLLANDDEVKKARM